MSDAIEVGSCVVVAVGIVAISAVVVGMLGCVLCALVEWVKELVRMFGRKKRTAEDVEDTLCLHQERIDGRIDRVWERFNNLADEYLEREQGITKLYMPKSDLVTCESCKCLLRKCDAYRGESVIEKPSSEFSGYVYMDGAGALCAGGSATERIRERYYCAVHKPKGKK
jgi:hypothetical protein